MEKRLILVIIISVGILVVYQELVGKYFMPKKTQPPALTETANSDKEDPSVVLQNSTDADYEPMKKTEVDLAGLDEGLKEQITAQKDYYLQNIEVTTPLYHATITNKGGRIKSWVLQKHQDEHRSPLELVSPKSNYKQHYPLNLILDDKKLMDRLNNSLYKIERIPAIGENVLDKIRCSYVDQSGIKITKELAFQKENYYVDIDIKIENLSETPLQFKYYLGWGYGLGPDTGYENTYSHTGATILLDGKLVQEKTSNIEGKLIKKGNVAWVALQNTYFAAFIVPQKGNAEALITKADDKHAAVGVSALSFEVTPGAGVSQRFGLYAGPQDMDKLTAAGSELEKIIDYGWFSFLAKPIMDILRFFHKYSGNYGIDIIILTIAIKLLLWPLTNASFKSMKDMQKVQPKISGLRKKYKDDPQRLNKEIMELYKKHKVNPVGGCLPMVLQIPIFFALYKALLISIELRHAPFMLWIQDLAAPEVGWFGLWNAPSIWLTMRTLPILMGITMFIQQKMTPSTGDPKQAKIMLMMPAVMTVIFYNMPAGLVIYFLLNNLLTIGQQHMINKKDD